jgi:pimeloyl-ACP methyl ester carboxylesterase
MENLYATALAVLLGAAVLGAVGQRVLCHRERRRFPPPGIRVDASGLALHFQVSGEGEPSVVLDSALAGTSLSWTEVQPRVAAFARVASYDRAGFGWSDPSSESRRVDYLVAELRRGLKALSLEPPYVLVGHSYGGFVAKLFWSRHPEEVAGVVLVDVPHPRKWVTPSASELRRIERGARMARVAGLLAHFGLARLFFRFAGPRRLESLPGLLSKLPASHQAAIRSFWVRPWTLQALSSLIEEAPRSAALVESSAGDLGDRPLVVLTASHPSPERIRDQEEVAKRSRCSRHVVAERSGHWIPLDEPEIVIEAIRDVVTEARRIRRSDAFSNGPGAEEMRGAGTTPSDP